MTNRYVTKAEREGTLRRQAAYRARKKGLGVRARSMMANDAEDGRLRQILSVWREEPANGLSDAQVEAAKVLAPGEKE